MTEVIKHHPVRQGRGFVPHTQQKPADYMPDVVLASFKNYIGAQDPSQNAYRYQLYENSGVRGFHTNLLATVPAVRIPALKVWARGILPRLADHPGTKETLYIDYSRHRAEDDQVQWQWRKFKYIVKQCNPKPATLGAALWSRP
jgi:hypothetical protein